MTPDRNHDRDPAGDFNPRKDSDDGIDAAAGGADSSPYEAEPSGEKTAKADDNNRKAGTRTGDVPV